MAKYCYEALKDNKTVVKGEIEALSPRDARDKVRGLGLMPLKVFNPELVFDEDETKSSNLGSVKSLGLTDKILFTSELQILLSASIPIIEALNSVEVNTPKIKIKRIAAELKNAIKSGMTFSDALEMYFHDVFGNTYIDLCYAGELAGELDVTLFRMLNLLKKQDNIKGKVIQALIYPVILVLLMFGIVVLFSKVIFPVFLGILGANQAAVPMFAAGVIGLCDFVNAYWLLCLIGIFAAFGIVNILATNKNTRIFFDKLLMSTPIVRDFVQLVNLSNYTCVLQISFDAGVPLLKGMEMSARTIGNTEIKKQAVIAKHLAEGGMVLSDALGRSNLLPGAFITMISSGEKSGNLSKMLNDILDVIDKKIDMVIEAFTRAFEPIMLIVMGGIVFVFALAFFQMYAGSISSY